MLFMYGIEDIAERIIPAVSAIITKAWRFICFSF